MPPLDKKGDVQADSETAYHSEGESQTVVVDTQGGRHLIKRDSQQNRGGQGEGEVPHRQPVHTYGVGSKPLDDHR